MSPALTESEVDNAKKCKAILMPLRVQDIRKNLSSLGVEDISNIQVFSSLSSTNDYLLEKESNSKQIAVCLAEQQTQGRGRYGHQWVSPLAVNLYLSISWPMQARELQHDALSLWLLIALAGVLERNGCKNIQLKWPNDICVQNKKLAGVLIERKVGKSKNNLIIGVGLNVAMSLAEEVSIDAPWIDLLMIKPDWSSSRNEIAASVVAALCDTLSKHEKNKLQDLNSAWSRYDMLFNKEVSFLYKEDNRKGWVKGIDELGQIVIEIDGKLESLHSAHTNEIKCIS